MDSIKFDYSKICNFVTKEEMIALYPEARQALKSLKEGTGKGSDFLGWLNLPVEITSEQLADIEKSTYSGNGRYRYRRLLSGGTGCHRGFGR